MQTQVGIVGAGPAGLMLSHILHMEGIESVIIEKHTQDYVEQRIRAGVLEQGAMDLINHVGVGERMMKEGMIHHGVKFRFDGETHRIDFKKHTGRGIIVYGQQEMVKDFIFRRLEDGGKILFESSDVELKGIDSDSPSIQFEHNGESAMLSCDIVAGCDGFHGVSRQTIPEGVLSVYEHTYNIGWFGVLAEAAPSSDEIIYSAHDRGFALHSMRSPTLSRNYIQCGPDDDPEKWSEQQIWDEFQRRMETHDGTEMNEGPILERTVAPLRGFVVEPMQYGNLYLAGDAAHIVPPTGAKGMNLALGDVKILAKAIVEKYRSGNSSELDGYSQACIHRIWRAQHFSWWMTDMLHRFNDRNDYQRQLQLSQLRYVMSSEPASRSLAENYVGMYWDQI